MINDLFGLSSGIVNGLGDLVNGGLGLVQGIINGIVGLFV